MARKAKVALKVLDFIVEYKMSHDGYAPSYQEIANHFGCSTTNAWNHLARLKRMGAIRFDDQHRYYVGGAWMPPSTHSPFEPPPRQPRKHNDRIMRDTDIQVMYKNQKGKCWWCGTDLYGIYDIDHRNPRANNGTDDPANLCLACPDCNNKKLDKMPWEFNGRLI
jgi:hypothetical protein